ncbi:hypothetical protein ACLI07_23050 (plasmid) [Providencia huaxiensis]|uniref:Uncharacterized protein n=7 Tax=Enterobacterales TaxID=91347 RepID=A0A7L8KB84_ECOLX|nr:MULTISPECIES: hypothetical protein [Enterobacterales]ELB1214885.1 hypothetical protein [Proteus mirabilis]ELY4881527.1 hypothetical protein [Morganella morganii]SPY66521.1 Uncharacterised protein [Providencia stuartii]ELR5094326.1 hypothetical protein [Providencia rettgeri]ELR5243175.1 hypothetical protein [Providencia rettgeri]
MKNKSFGIVLKKCLADAAGYAVEIIFIMSIFFLLAYSASLFGEPSIWAVIGVTAVIYIFGSKSLKVNVASAKAHNAVLRYLDDRFP